MPLTHLSSFIKKIAHRQMRIITSEDETELNDLSYEDALLDLQMRSFFRAEYGKQEPPEGVFPRLMRAIYLYREDQARHISVGLKSRVGQIIEPLGRGLAALYQATSRADTGRVISGGMVAALLMLATWPSMIQVLGYNTGMVGPQESRLVNGSSSGSETVLSPTNAIMVGTAEYPTAVPIHNPQSAVPNRISPGIIYDQPRLLLEQRTGEDFDAPPPEWEDPSYLHPFERGITNKKINGPHTEPSYERPIIGQE